MQKDAATGVHVLFCASVFYLMLATEQFPCQCGPVPQKGVFRSWGPIYSMKDCPFCGSILPPFSGP